MQAEWIVVAGARWPVAAAGSSCPVLDVRSEADRRLGALFRKHFGAVVAANGDVANLNRCYVLPARRRLSLSPAAPAA